MTVTRATWLADELRAAGLTVKTYPGWESRGKPFRDLRAVVWHHDASPAGDSPGVPAYMLREMAAGRAGAQLWVDRRGAWHVLASGVAFHAGAVLAGMPGNHESLGVETDHTTDESWPSAQLLSLRRGTAAILRRIGQDATGLHMHKTICSPRGRKVDPDGLDLHNERGRLAVLMASAALKTTPAPPPAPVQEDDMAVRIKKASSNQQWLVHPATGAIPIDTTTESRAWVSAGLAPGGEPLVLPDAEVDALIAAAARR